MTNPYQTLVYKPINNQNIVQDNALILSLAGNFTIEMCFHIIQSEQISLSTDITDHIVEDHTSVQDHITIKPRTFTMKGLISEKVFVHPDSIDIDVPTEPWDKKLTKLGVIAPTLSSYVASAVNAAEGIASKIVMWSSKAYYAITSTVRGLANFIQRQRGLKPVITVDQTHKRWSDDYIQKSIIEILDFCRINRIPVNVNTGWGMELKNSYYITDIQVNQGDNYQQSELSVTLKELRFTTIKTQKMSKEDINRFQIQEKESKKTVNGNTGGELKSKAYVASGRT